MHAPPPATSRRLQRLVGITLGVLAVCLLLAGALWWGLPALLRSQLPPRLSQALGRPVSLDDAHFEARPLTLLLQGLRIGPAGGAPGGAPAGAAGEPLLQAERLRIGLAFGATLWQRAPVISSLVVDGLRLRLARTAPGHYDVDDLIAKLGSAPQDGAANETLRFALHELALRDAEIHFDDRPAAALHRVQALNLSLPLLSSLPDDSAAPAVPQLAFTLDGARVDARGRALPFAATKSGELALTVVNLDLKPWLGYVPAGLPVQLQRGHLDTTLSLHLTQPPQGAPTLQLQGQVSLRDVALAEPDGTALGGWRALALELRDVQPLQQQVALGTLRIEGAELRLARDAHGRLNLQRLQPAKSPPPGLLTAAPATSAAGTATAAAPQPWQIALAALHIEGGRVHWQDATLRPVAHYTIDPLTLELRDLHWPLQAAMPLTASAALHATTGRGDAPVAGRLQVDGTAGETQAQLALKLDGLDLAALSPYLGQALRPRPSGRLSAQAQLHWAARPAALAIDVDTATLQDLQLRDGRSRSSAPLAAMRQVQVAGAKIDLQAQALEVGRLRISQPQVTLARRRDGQLDLAAWLPPAAAAPAPRQTARARQSPAWRLALRDLAVDGGRLGWTDAAVGAPAADGPLRAELSGLKLRMQGLTWPAAARAPQPRLQLSASIGAMAAQDPTDRGTLDWQGRFGLAPLQANGRLTLHRVPLHLAAPYAGDALPVQLQHADLSLQTQLSARSTPAGWQLSTDGDLQVTELQVLTRAAADAGDRELLSWQSLSLRGLALALAPPARPRLDIRELALNDFYSRLVVTEQGRFNLQDLRPAAAASAAPAVATAAPAPAPAAAQAAPADEGLPIDLVLGPTTLRNGRIDFSDHFIRPNYSARLTELNGQIGALRSGTREMAAISLHGRAADTALVDISGQINPTARPLALDIRARATDLELAPLSPYAGKYAGYAIERGKLSMDVAYKIEADGKLEASNQVILNQLTFGDRVESPSATKLPVLLAVALLKDRNGVIDINLPISGSVNDPQFSVGSIIWKLILNLLGKALTAPFSLLAGGGGADDLSQVGFVPGTARFTEAGAQSLKRVARALTDRPALSMTVTGTADLASERDDARHEALERQLQAEFRRERLRAAPAAGVAASAPAVAAAADLPPLTDADRARLLKRLYQQAPLPDKPRNAIGLLRDLPPEQMQARLSAAIPVTEDSMRELALQRGLAVRDALIAEGLPSARLFLAAPKLRPPGQDQAPWSPQVTLTLSAK